MSSAKKSLLSMPLLTTLQLDLSHIESGVPLATMSDFATSSGLPMEYLYDVVIPARTLKHRRDRKQPLSREESDKLARLVRVFDHTVKVFGDLELARKWLNKSKKRFAGRTPLEMLQTDAGARMVEELLGQIDYGMFA